MLTDRSDDLLFSQIADLPNVFTTFRKSLEPLRDRPRKTLLIPDVLPTFPDESSVLPVRDGFSIPETQAVLSEGLLKPLGDLIGLSPPPIQQADDIATYNAYPFSGGESATMN